MGFDEQLNEYARIEKQKREQFEEAAARVKILVERTPVGRRNAVFGAAFARVKELSARLHGIQAKADVLKTVPLADISDAEAIKHTRTAIDHLGHILATYDELLALLATFDKLADAVPTSGVH